MTIESKNRRKAKPKTQEKVETTFTVDGRALSMVLFFQCVANARRVSLQKRYMAMAKDLQSLAMGETATSSKELV